MPLEFKNDVPIAAKVSITSRYYLILIYVEKDRNKFDLPRPGLFPPCNTLSRSYYVLVQSALLYPGTDSLLLTLASLNLAHFVRSYSTLATLTLSWIYPTYPDLLFLTQPSPGLIIPSILLHGIRIKNLVGIRPSVDLHCPREKYG